MKAKQAIGYDSVTPVYAHRTFSAVGSRIGTWPHAYFLSANFQDVSFILSSPFSHARTHTTASAV